MIPEHPQFSPRCHVIADGEDLLLRQGRTFLRVTTSDRVGAFRRLLSVLDGRCALDALTSSHADGLGTGLQLMDELARSALLVEWGTTGAQRQAQPLTNAVRSSAGKAAISVFGDSSVGASARSVLRAAGGLAENAAAAQFRLVCYLSPQLKALRQLNAELITTRTRWMAAFPLGGELIVGPVIRPGVSACFRCFELRSLGMCASIPAERLYLNHLAERNWAIESLGEADAQWLGRFSAQAALSSAMGSQDGSLWIVSEGGEISKHHVLRHPGCEVCGEGVHARASLWQNWQTQSHGIPLEQLRMASVIDDRVGLAGCVESLDEEDGESGDTLLYSAVAQFSEPSPEIISKAKARGTGGYEASSDRAKRVAVVEALERYCGIFPRKADVTASFEELIETAICPTELPLFSAAQYSQPGFPFCPFTPGLEIGWMRGFSLTHEKERLVPLCAATYGPCKERLFDECSSGVAARGSLVEAVYRGALELIERDSFMIFWLNRLAPPLLALDRLRPGFASSSVSEMRRYGYAVYAANLTTDLGVPVMLAMGVREDGVLPALVVGAGCAPSPQEALDKAFKEALVATRWNAKREWSLKPAIEARNIIQLEDHSDAYSHPDWLPKASFLWSSQQEQVLDELPEVFSMSLIPGTELNALTDLLERHGLELIGIDLTTPDVEPTGLRVARAIVPGLQPIGFGAHAVRLGGRRLYEAPYRMGYLAAPSQEADLNRDPHCFP